MLAKQAQALWKSTRESHHKKAAYHQKFSMTLASRFNLDQGSCMALATNSVLHDGEQVEDEVDIEKAFI
ncbi:MAG: hypothetical protein AAF471_01925 [Myxococcota bacterium]